MPIEELVKNNTKSELLELCETKNVLCKKSWTKTKLAEAIITKITGSKSSKKNSNKSPTRKSAYRKSSVLTDRKSDSKSPKEVLHQKYSKKLFMNTPTISEEYKTKVHIIPINLSKEMEISSFSLFDYFKHAANISSKNNFDKRKAVLIFNRDITNFNLTDWKKKQELLYIFTINKKIVKIGGSRDGIYGRINSYLAGHYTCERGHKGTCSITNARIYNTFDYYITEGCEIDMYVYEIPNTPVSKNIFGKDCEINIQTYHAYESVALDKYRNQNGKFPKLSLNSDPKYKKCV